MRSVLAALFLLCAFVAPAWADRFALRYDGVGLGFVPLGTVVLDADVSSDRYAVTATLQSRGLLNLFERTQLRAEASGLIQNGAVQWRSYDLDHRYSRKRRQIAMRVSEEGALSANIVPTYRIWGDPPASEQQRRQSRDPLSTLIAMAVDVGATRRCSGAYPTFDGRFYYLLELGGGEIERFNDAGFRGEVLRCSLAYIAVAGFERRDAGRRRIPQGRIWFALMPDTRFAPPVRISTPISAGGAVIRLASFQRPRVEIEDAAPAAP